MSRAEPSDLVRYGLIPEFVGRFPIITTTKRLTEGELKQVLTEPKNALLKQYRYLFALNDADFVVTRDAISEVARLAIKKRTGARALRNILESMLLEAMFQAPDDDVATVLWTSWPCAAGPVKLPREARRTPGRRRRSPTRTPLASPLFL